MNQKVPRKLRPIQLGAPAVFIGSPGDLSQERQALKLWLEPEIAERNGVSLFAYEYDMAYFQSGLPPQQQIPFPSDPFTVATIGMFSERVGSFVGNDFILPDGFRAWLDAWQRPIGSPIGLPGGPRRLIPLSGTMFEVLDAIRTATHDKPIYLFVKGGEKCTPRDAWSKSKRIEKVPPERGCGFNIEREKGNPEYDAQLGMLDAFLRILNEQKVHFETFSNVEELQVKVGARLRALLRDEGPVTRRAFRLSLQALGTDDSDSLFGRDADIQKLIDTFRVRHNPLKPGDTLCVLHGPSGSGKSSVARAGFLTRVTKRHMGLHAAGVDTSPLRLAREGRPMCAALAEQILALVEGASFDPVESPAWKSALEAGDPVELARLLLALVDRSPRKVLPVVVLDQFEQAWTDGNTFPQDSRRLLDFVRAITATKKIWCLLVLQSEPPEGASSGGRLGSLRGLSHGYSYEDVKLSSPNGATAAAIAGNLFRQQTTSDIPDDVADAICESANLLSERGVSYLPLLALRVGALCDAWRRQAEGRDTSLNVEQLLEESAARLRDPFITAEWMRAPLTGEIEELGLRAWREVRARTSVSPAAQFHAFDFCLTRLVATKEEKANARSERCTLLEAEQQRLFAKDQVVERVFVDVLCDFRLARRVGVDRVRLNHVSIVDHWSNAQKWFDQTEKRRAGASRAQLIFAKDNTQEMALMALNAPRDLAAVEAVLPGFSQSYVALPGDLPSQREIIFDTLAAHYRRLKPRQRLARVNVAIHARVPRLTDRYLEPSGEAKLLEKIALDESRTPFLVALAESGDLEGLVRCVRDGCDAVRVYGNRATVISALMQRGPEGMATARRILFGDPSSQLPALSTNDANRLLQMRTGSGHSIIDLAVATRSTDTVKASLALVDGLGRALTLKLLDPRKRDITTALPPLHRAAEANDTEMVRLLLDEGKARMPEEEFAAFLNAIPRPSRHAEACETALSRACATGAHAVAAVLVENGARADAAVYNGLDAYAQSVLRDDAALLMTLRPDRLTSGHQTALAHIAATNDALECLTLLVGQRPPRTGGPPTPLHTAACEARAATIADFLSRLSPELRGSWANAPDRYGRTPLMAALIANRTDTAAAILDAGGDQALDAENYLGYRALHYAARFSGAAGVELLQRYGAEISFARADKASTTPLHLAAMVGDVGACALLVDDDALRRMSAHGRNAIHTAARHGHDSALALLLQHGGDVTTRSLLERQNPLHLAAHHGHADCLRTILEYRRSTEYINALDGVLRTGGAPFGGRTALWSAATSGHVECVRLLLDAGANPDLRDVSGRAALEKALTNQHNEVVNLLLQAGANTEGVNGGRTALFYASMSGNHSAFTAIRAARAARGHVEKAEDLIGQSDSETSPLTIALKRMEDHVLSQTGFAALRESVELEPQARHDANSWGTFDPAGALRIASDILASGAFAHTGPRRLREALWAAALTGQADLVRDIPDPPGGLAGVRDNLGLTAMHVAARSCDIATMRLLCQRGLRVDEGASDGVTPLMRAVLYGDAEDLSQFLTLMREELSDISAAINAQDMFGETVLHKLAASPAGGGSKKLALLLAAGADPSIVSIDGESAFHVLRFYLDSGKSRDASLADAFQAAQALDAPPNGRRVYRSTWPLHAAIWGGHFESVDRLIALSRPFALTATDPPGRTPLMALLSAESQQWSDAAFEELVRRLWHPPELQDSYRRTLAHYAAMATRSIAQMPRGDVRSLETLNAHNTSINWNARDIFLRTPLHIAASLGSVEPAVWLLNKNVELLPDSFGNTALHLAAALPDREAYDRLTERASPSDRDRRNGLDLSAADIAKGALTGAWRRHSPEPKAHRTLLDLLRPKPKS